MDIHGYEYLHNGYSHEYGYEYETYIYPANMYERAITRTLHVPLTFLILIICELHINVSNYVNN